MDMKLNSLINKIGKRTGLFVGMFILVLSVGTGCFKHPIDEDGLLITERSECYVGSFEIYATDLQTARAGVAPVIDTVACTISVVLKYGTDLKNLWPNFGLVTDAKLEPKVTGWEDFSDLANPRKWTVISGNRKIRKTYTVTVRVQQQ